jgi:hypothetical protein
MATWENVLSELVCTRLRADQLDEHVADAIDLLHGILTTTLDGASAEIKSKLGAAVRLKLFQLPQGCAIGRRLAELDEKFGGPLEGQGILLSRWVYEPRDY